MLALVTGKAVIVFGSLALITKEAALLSSLGDIVAGNALVARLELARRTEYILDTLSGTILAAVVNDVVIFTVRTLADVPIEFLAEFSVTVLASRIARFNARGIDFTSTSE